MNRVQVRWAAIGAAVAVSVGAGGLGLVHATNPDGASAYQPSSPCRIIDTRPGVNHVGAFGVLGADSTVTVVARGDVGECEGADALPVDATGLQLNVTPIGATLLTHLTIYPGGGDPPNASSLNPAPGQPPIPNAVAVELSEAGEFSIYNFQGTVDVVVDVVGYFTDHDHDDRYYTAADVIPPGVTVTGVITVDTATHGDTSYDAISVDLPGVAPVDLLEDDVNFANAEAADTDPECTGRSFAPTAPPGKVCLYLSGLDSLRVENIGGFSSDLRKRAFEVRFTPTTDTPGEDMHLYATWAYTAPAAPAPAQPASDVGVPEAETK